jgi:NAD(P)H dehydrogenase (quinone)
MISMPGPVEVRIPLHRAAFDAARDVGIGRLVYTSRVAPSPQSLYPFAPVHAFSEEYIETTGIPTTLIRNNEYVENIQFLLDAALKTGKLMMPGASGKVPYISVENIAEIIAKIVLEEGHAGQIYELNGPEALCRSDIADLLSATIRKPIEVAAVGPDEYSRFIESLGYPPFLVEMVKGLYKAIDAGEFAKIWPDAPRLLGRPTRSVAEYIHSIYGRS